MESLKRFDKIVTGLIFGLIGPWLGMLVFYAIMFNHRTLDNFLRMIANNAGTQAPLIAVCLVFNLVFFFAALQKNWYRTAQGVIMATFIYAPVMIYLKYG